MLMSQNENTQTSRYYDIVSKFIGYGLDGVGIESRSRKRFSTNVQTVPGAHPVSYTMGTGCLAGGKAARGGVALTTHPI
jgi:hypothetical protein